MGRHRQVEHIKFAAASASSGAPWRPGAALASRGAGDALRFVGVATHDWLQPPVHSGGPSSLISRPNCAPKAAMDSCSYGAHACMLGARFGVRAAEVRHLAVLSAHGCMACRVYWLPTHPMHMTQVNVQRRDRALKVLQDRALIKQNLRPTVGGKKWSPSGNKRKRLGATVKANAFYGSV